MSNNNNLVYIGTYKVVKIFRVSNRRQVLKRGLTIDEAKRVVNVRVLCVRAGF